LQIYYLLSGKSTHTLLINGNTFFRTNLYLQNGMFWKNPYYCIQWDFRLKRIMLFDSMSNLFKKLIFTTHFIKMEKSTFSIVVPQFTKSLHCNRRRTDRWTRRALGYILSTDYDVVWCTSQNTHSKNNYTFLASPHLWRNKILLYARQ